jgi:hypothetical protein
LIEMLERLPMLNGVLTKRAMLEAQEQQPGGAVSGVTVGPTAGASGSPGYSPTGSRREVEYVESTGAMLTGHPSLAGIVEFAQA